MKSIIYLAITSLSLAFVFSSCTKDEITDPVELEVSASYDSTNWSQNISSVIAYENRFNDLVNYMKTGQDTMVTLSLPLLNDYFSDGGTASLKASNSDFALVVESYYFPALVANSGHSFNPAMAPNASVGGVFYGRLLNKSAFEILQGVDKGLYAAGFLKQVFELSNKTITQESLDQMLKLYGAHPSFPNTSNAAKAIYPDSRVANYAARRDQNDGAGLYTQIKNNFLVIQATFKKSGFEAERTNALKKMRLNMEKALAATSINYIYAAIDKLSATNPTDEDKAAALHDLGESYGFLLGLAFLKDTDRKIITSDLEEVFVLMGKTANDIEMYSFVNDPAANLKYLQEAQDKLKAAYSFTTQEMTEFKTNWVSAQSR